MCNDPVFAFSFGSCAGAEGAHRVKPVFDRMFGALSLGHFPNSALFYRLNSSTNASNFTVYFEELGNRAGWNRKSVL